MRGRLFARGIDYAHDKTINNHPQGILSPLACLGILPLSGGRSTPFAYIRGRRLQQYTSRPTKHVNASKRRCVGKGDPVPTKTTEVLKNPGRDHHRRWGGKIVVLQRVCEELVELAVDLVGLIPRHPVRGPGYLLRRRPFPLLDFLRPPGSMERLSRAERVFVRSVEE